MYLDYVNLFNVSRLLPRERPVSLLFLWIYFLVYCVAAPACLFLLFSSAGGILGTAVSALLAVLLFVFGRAMWKLRFWPAAVGCGLGFTGMLLAQFGIVFMDWGFSFESKFVSWAWSSAALAALVRVRGRLSVYAADTEDEWGRPAWLAPPAKGLP